MKIRTTAILLIILTGPQAVAQVSFWNNLTAPLSQDTVSDTSPVTLGIRFYSDVPGSLTGIRFFKGLQNTGQHVGILWSSTGTNIAQVTFSGETASGWQQVNFPSPVSIFANTTYIVSYFAPKANYALDENYSWATLSTPSLHPSGADPGVYSYSSGASFPSSMYKASNYWVDPIFVANSTTPPGGSGSSSFWTTSTTPVSPDATNDPSAVTLGLKFSSDVPGSINGLRFYKGSNNVGLHVGTLWSNTGAKLAEVAFSGETTTGWQQAMFSAPVIIQAKTTYVVSYFAPHGNYADDQTYSWSSLNAIPLHFAGSSPGVYAYSSGTAFPQSTYNGTNYWVDPIFARASSLPTYGISGTVTGSAATLTLSGASSNSGSTNASGGYTLSGLANGAYVVAASQPGYTFNPTTSSVVINGVSVAGVNFKATNVPHSVTITWTPSVSANVNGYNLYRATLLGGPYTKLTTSPISGSGYFDNGVMAGHTYYYAATAVDTVANKESGYSNVSIAMIPTP